MSGPRSQAALASPQKGWREGSLAVLIGGVFVLLSLIEVGRSPKTGSRKPETSHKPRPPINWRKCAQNTRDSQIPNSKPQTLKPTTPNTNVEISKPSTPKTCKPNSKLQTRPTRPQTLGGAGCAIANCRQRQRRIAAAGSPGSAGGRALNGALRSPGKE